MQGHGWQIANLEAKPGLKQGEKHHQREKRDGDSGKDLKKWQRHQQIPVQARALPWS